MPPLIKAGLCIICWGVAFPIYGIPLGSYGKLTAFRLGLMLLVMSFPYWGTPLRRVLPNRFIIGCMGLIIIRGCSLLLSPNKADGVPQLEWFIESFSFLLIFSAYALRNPEAYRFMFRWLLIAGSASAAVAVLQYAQFLNAGWVSPLPLSTGRFGIPDATGWYPLGVDNRILGAFQEPNQTASFMVYLLALLLPALPGTRRRLQKIAFGATIVIILLALWSTGSRQGLVACYAMIAIYVFNHVDAKRLSVVILSLLPLLWYGKQVWDTYELHSVAEEGIHGDVALRTTRELESRAEGTGMLGIRSDYSVMLLKSLGPQTLLLGQGEGSGEWAAHNAYLITLQESGACALLILVYVTVGLFLVAEAKVLRRREYAANWPFLDTAAMIGAVWILLLYLNWAQMNQNQIWPFLVFVFGADLWQPVLRHEGIRDLQWPRLSRAKSLRG